MHNTPIVVSFSGGRTSAYMLRRLLDTYPDRRIYVVFANTGKELPETLYFVNECSQRWNVEIIWIQALVHAERGVGTAYEVVHYETADRIGHTFEAVIAKYGIPSKAFPHCSRELKIQPIKKWVADVVGTRDYDLAIGIRYDEQDRIKDAWYPLVEWRVTKALVRQFWDQQPFDLQLKDYEGNCDLCWKKSMRKNLTVLEERPGVGEWWDEMESKYSGTNPRNPTVNTGQPKWYFHHGNRSTAQLIALGQRGKFQRAHDEHLLKKDALLDFELSCSCGLQ